MTSLADLELRVDATQPKAAASALDSLTVSSGKAEASTGALGKASGASAAELAVFQSKAIAATVAQTGMTRAQAAAALGFKDVEAAAKLGGVAHKELALAASGAEAALGHVGSASQRTREGLVLLHEFIRGDFKRGVGSALIELQNFGLLGAVFSPLGIGIAIATAGLGLLAYATIKGEDEMRKFGASLITTGNYAGQTADSLKIMGQTIAASSHTTESSSRAVVESLVATGKIGAGALGSLADAAQNYAKITGENGTKFAKEYEGMGDHLVRFAVKHEDVYHDLTLQQVQAINNLVKQGKEEEAQAQLAADIDASSKRRLAESLVQQQAQVDHYGILMRTLHAVGEAAKSMWDKILNIGRPDTPGDEVKKAQQTLNSFNSPYNLQNNTSAVQAGRAAAAASLAAAQGRVSADDNKAAADAAAAKANHDAIQKQFGDGKSRAAHEPTDDNATALDTAEKARLTAEQALTKNVEEVAQFKRDEITTERALQEDRLVKQRHAKSITDATKAAAEIAYDAAAKAKLDLINRNEVLDVHKRELDQAKALNTDAQAISTIRAGFAATAQERAKIEDAAVAATQKIDAEEYILAVQRLVVDHAITEDMGQRRIIGHLGLDIAKQEQQVEKDRVAIAHGAALNAQAVLEQTIAEKQSQASLLTSTYARAVAERDILKSTQELALSRAQDAVDGTKAGSDERRRAEQALAGLKARQAADKTLLERQTDLVHGIQDAAGAALSLRDALARHDWASVFDDFQRTIDSIKGAFKANGLTGGVLSAGSAVASLIGGKAGNAIGSGLGVAGLGLTASTALINAGSLGALGGLSGSAIGLGSLLGPIGIIAGIGVALVSLLKSKPSNDAAIASIAGTSGFAISGDKQTSATAQAAASAANAVLQGEQLLQAAGIKLATTVSKIDIGARDLTHVFLSTGEELRTAIGDPAAAAEAGLKAVLKGATYTSDAEKRLVESLLAAGDGFDKVATALQNYTAAQQVSASIATQILQLKDPKAFDLKAVHDAITAQKSAAQAAAVAGYLTADQLSTINGQLGTLENLQIDVVMKRYASAATTATDIMTAAQTDVTNARQAAQVIYDTQVAAYQAIITKAQAAADSLGKFRDSLTSGPLANLSATGQLAATRAQFNALAALPAGDPRRLGGLETASNAFLTAAKAAEPSQLAYYRDLAAVRRATDESAKAAQAQVSDAQQQLDALDALVKGQLTVAAAVTQGSQDIVAALASLAASEQVVANLAQTQAAAAAPTTQTAPVNDNSTLTAPTFTGPAAVVDTAAIVAAVAGLQDQMVSVQTAINAQTKTLLVPAKKAADILVNVSRGGEAFQTAVA